MVVKRSQAAQGHDGEQLHVRGPRMEMRVWENVPCGYHFAPHDCAVDIAGFITKGSGLWLIDGQEVIISAGDSYYSLLCFAFVVSVCYPQALSHTPSRERGNA